MVGLTHEDIDQVFSCVSSHLKKNLVRLIDKSVVGMIAMCIFKYGSKHWTIYCIPCRVSMSIFESE